MEKIQKNKRPHNRIGSIIEFNGKWDAEDISNFGEPILGLFSCGKWELIDLKKGFSKLFNDYEWKEIFLSDNRLVFLTNYNDIYVVKFNMLEDGGVELTSWDMSRESTPTSLLMTLYGNQQAIPSIEDMPIDDLNPSMEYAVKTEEYEKAAVIRDEIIKRQY